MKDYLSLKTDLAKAKNFGSSGHGSHHWLMQRLTALLLIPLFVWFGFFLSGVFGKTLPEIVILLKKPINLFAFSILLITSLYHSMLGMQIVIEDYITCIKLRNSLIILLKLIIFTTSISLLIVMVYFISNGSRI